jgi:hypothetical protein
MHPARQRDAPASICAATWRSATAHNVDDLTGKKIPDDRSRPVSGAWTRARGAAPGRAIVATMPMDINTIVGGLNAPHAPFVPEQHDFAPGYALLLAGFNGTPEHAELVSRIRQTIPPLSNMLTPMPYVALQTMLDEAAA